MELGLKMNTHDQKNQHTKSLRVERQVGPDPQFRSPRQPTTVPTKTRHVCHHFERSHAPEHKIKKEPALAGGVPLRVWLRKVAQSHVDILPVASKRAPIWSQDGGSPRSCGVWTRCCDDKTLLAAIREQREQSSISPSSNPRSSIDFPWMRNGRREKAQSDAPRRPHSVCACVRMHACVCVYVCKRQDQNRTNGCQTKVTTLVNHYLCSSVRAHMTVAWLRWPLTLQRKTTRESVKTCWASNPGTSQRDGVFKSQGGI